MKKITPKKSSSWFLQLNNFYPHPNPCKFCIAKKRQKWRFQNLFLTAEIFYNCTQYSLSQEILEFKDDMAIQSNSDLWRTFLKINFLQRYPFCSNLWKILVVFLDWNVFFFISFSIACYKLKIKINILKKQRKWFLIHTWSNKAAVKSTVENRALPRL